MLDVKTRSKGDYAEPCKATLAKEQCTHASLRIPTGDDFIV
jgi:hypothetical protein